MKETTVLAMLVVHAACSFAQPSAGSLYSPGGLLANASRDLRASQPGDIVTILVSDRATAVAKGTVTSSRKSAAKYGVGAFLGPAGKRIGPDLLRSAGERELQGDAETSRENLLTTSLSARVVQVLQNGNLVVEGTKQIQTNSEKQTVSIRGIVRPFDLSPANSVRSDRLAELEVKVDGKGVVGDTVKRPFFLYRILLGLLPF